MSAPIPEDEEKVDGFYPCGHAFSVEGRNLRCNVQRGHHGGHVHVSEGDCPLITLSLHTSSASERIATLESQLAEAKALAINRELFLQEGIVQNTAED